MTQRNKEKNTDTNLMAMGLGFRKTDLLFENMVWLSSEDAAKYLGRSTGQIRNMVYRRQVSHRKFCNRLYFRKTELDRAIESSNKKGF